MPGEGILCFSQEIIFGYVIQSYVPLFAKCEQQFSKYYVYVYIYIYTYDKVNNVKILSIMISCVHLIKFS